MSLAFILQKSMLSCTRLSLHIPRKQEAGLLVVSVKLQRLSLKMRWMALGGMKRKSMTN